ncbi:MAG: TIGR02206 family membrane protein, partial [Gemmatimonadota bacterium]
IRFFQTLTSHGLVLTAALFMTLVEGMRPVRRSLIRVLLGMNAYVLFVALVNTLIGSNYLFIAHKPETASIVDFLGPWPWYILGMEVIGFANCLVLYAPFEWLDRRRRALAAASA